MRVGEPAGHRERVARPQSPDKTAHRLQHTQIERAGRESQTACELRRETVRKYASLARLAADDEHALL